MMNKNMIKKMQSQFDSLAHHMPDTDMEFWFARELQEPLGYTKWERFKNAVERAISSCKTTGYESDDHFRGVTKMIALGKGGKTVVERKIVFMRNNKYCRTWTLHKEIIKKIRVFRGSKLRNYR